MNDPGPSVPPTPPAGENPAADSIAAFFLRLGRADTGTAPAAPGNVLGSILWSPLPTDADARPHLRAGTSADAAGADPIPTLRRRLAESGATLSRLEATRALAIRILSMTCQGARAVGVILPRSAPGQEKAMASLEHAAQVWHLPVHRAAPDDPQLPAHFAHASPIHAAFGVVLAHPAAGTPDATPLGREGDSLLLLETAVEPAPPLPSTGHTSAPPEPGAEFDAAGGPFSLEAARLLDTSLLGLLATGDLHGAWVVGPEGLGVTLAQACLTAPMSPSGTHDLGATLDLTDGTPDVTALERVLFEDTAPRVLVTCGPMDATKILERARILGLAPHRIGVVGGDRLVLGTGVGEFVVSLADLRTAMPPCGHPEGTSGS